MDNLYNKYWIENEQEIHTYDIGTYHVSQIGNSHTDLESDEHSGPCLRQGYWEYLEPIEKSVSTIGNFELGKIIHEKIQELMKLNNPATVNEFPLRVWLKKIILSGSVDTIVFTKDGLHVIDFKSASQYTLPKGDYDKNPTHFTQVYIYAFLLSKIFTLDIQTVSVVYINKHNLATYKQTEKYDTGKAIDIYVNFVERCNYLNECLEKKKVPIPEPMRWCKYCDYRERCKEQGDVELVLTKRGAIKGLKVVDNGSKDNS